MSSMKSLLRARTNQKTAIAALAFMVLGLLVFLLAQSLPSHWPVRSILNDVGSFFLATVVVGLVWELLARRNLLDEMESRGWGAREAEKTGLIGFGVDRELVTDNDIPAEAFGKADVLLGFNDEKESLWYQHDEFDDVIRRIAAREGAQLRIVLPRPKHWVRTVLAKRRMNDESGTESELKQARIAVQSEIEKALKGIRAKLRDRLKEERWELRWIDQPTFFSYARFDDRATVLLGKRAGGKKVGGGQKTPKLTLRRLPHLPAVGSRSPRDLFEFFEREFNLLFDRGEVPPEH